MVPRCQVSGLGRTDQTRHGLFNKFDRPEIVSLPQYLGTVVVVFHGVLYKAEAIDVTHVGVAVGPEKVKPTHRLLEPTEHTGSLSKSSTPIIAPLTQLDNRSTTFPSNVLTCAAHGCSGPPAYLEGQADLAGHQLLHGCEHDRVADLLPLAVSLHLPVQGWGLARLRMGVVRPYRVHLDTDTHTHRESDG